MEKRLAQHPKITGLTFYSKFRKSQARAEQRDNFALTAL